MGRGDIGRDNTSRLGERSLAVSATVALDGGLKDAATAPCRRCESSRGEAGRGEAGRGEAGRGEAGRGDAGAAEARKGRGDDGSRRGDGAWPRGDSACTWSSVFEPLGIGEIIMESPLGRTAFVVVLVLVLVPLLVGLLLAGAGAAGAAKGSPLPLNKCHSGRRWLELGSRMRARSSFVITGGSAATRGRAVSGGPQRGQSSDTARGVGAISSFDTHIGDAMHAGLSCRAHGEHSKSSVHVTAPLRSFRELVYEGWGLILSRQTSRGTQDTTHGTQRQHDGRRDPHIASTRTPNQCILCQD